MPTIVRANVNPRILVWGREHAGLSPEDAARKVGVSLEKLRAWEAGDARPTVRQARLLGKAYRRPSAFFYLYNPPESPPDLPDFRRLPDAQREMTPDLLYEVRRARFRRDIALEVFPILGEKIPGFELEVSASETPEVVGMLIRRYLALEEKEQFSWRGPYKALNAWTRAVESAGILVFQFSGVDVRLARGFSIADTPLNGADSPRARIFTLLHECCHLALGTGGLCDLHENHGSESIETYCNAAAAESLVPSSLLLQQREVADNLGEPFWPNSVLNTLANRFSVSREVILRRFLHLGKTTPAIYREKREEFEEEYKRLRERGGGFIKYPKKVVRDNGHAFTSLLLDAYQQQAITAIDLSRYLGDIRLNHLDSIQNELLS
jgi:Zn-dependent peptidase ImmA (M78 family)/DNA-binding XRE family transcriptional regulator